MKMLLFQNTIFGVVPAEFSLLEDYLRQPYQDPEWVEFVREQLRTSPPAELAIRFQSFMGIELCSSTREQIIDLYKQIYFGRQDPLIFIPEVCLETILKAHLQPVEFNHSALCEVLRTLCQDRHESAFYSEVLTDKAEAFQGFWEEFRNREILKNKRYLENQQIIQWEKDLQRRQEENAALGDNLYYRKEALNEEDAVTWAHHAILAGKEKRAVLIKDRS